MHCNFQSLASQITTHNIKHPIHTKTNSETGETQFVCCLPVWVTAAFTLCNYGSSNVSKKCGMQHLYASGRWWKAGGHQRQVLGLFLGSAVPSLVISVPAGEADEAACRPTVMFGPGAPQFLQHARNSRRVPQEMSRDMFRGCEPWDPRCKILTVPGVRQAISASGWFATTDLKDAYFQIPICQGHWQFLGFGFEGTGGWSEQMCSFKSRDLCGVLPMNTDTQKIDTER